MYNLVHKAIMERKTWGRGVCGRISWPPCAVGEWVSNILGIGCNPTIPNSCCTRFIPTSQPKFSCGFSFTINGVPRNLRKWQTRSETAINCTETAHFPVCYSLVDALERGILLIHPYFKGDAMGLLIDSSVARTKINLVQSLTYSHFSVIYNELCLSSWNRNIFIEISLGSSLQTVSASYSSKCIKYLKNGQTLSGQINPEKFASENMILELNGSYCAVVLLHRIQSLLRSWYNSHNSFH